MAKPDVHIDLIRHGPTVSPNTFIGRNDVDLDLTYIDAGDKYLENISQYWRSVISSPLKRCAIPAKKLAQKKNVPLHIEENIREYDFGDWEGKPISQVTKEDPKAVNAFLSNPYASSPPNSEPLQSFEKRVTSTVETIVRNNKNQHIGVLCHGGVIRAVLGKSLNLPIQKTFAIKVDYFCRLSLDVWIEKELMWQISGIDNPRL